MATGHFNNIVLGTNLSGVNNGDGSITLSATGGAPTGAAGGDLTGTYPNPTLGTAGPGATGPIGDATHAPIVTIDAKGRVTALSSAVISGGSPSGSAGGDLTGTYPNPTLTTAGPGATGPVGSSTVAPIITIDAKGRVTALSSATITPAAGSGGALTLAFDSLLGADAASFDITGISGAYSQLLLVLYLRSDRATTTDSVQMRFNNLSTGIYYGQIASWAAAAAVTPSEELAVTSSQLGRCPANTGTSLRFSAMHVWIPNYANATNHKSWIADGLTPHSTTSGTITRLVSGGTVEVTAAVSRVTVFPGVGPNFKAGSRATLYGLA